MISNLLDRPKCKNEIWNTYLICSSAISYSQESKLLGDLFLRMVFKTQNVIEHSYSK